MSSRYNRMMPRERVQQARIAWGLDLVHTQEPATARNERRLAKKAARKTRKEAKP